MRIDLFLQSFSGFADTAPVLIQAKLDLAAAMMGGTVDGGPGGRWALAGGFAAFGQKPTKVDAAHGNLTAALLMEDPQGAAGRAEIDGKTVSVYRQSYEALALAIAAGPIVSGGGLLRSRCW